MGRLAGSLALVALLAGAGIAGAQQYVTPGGDQYFQVEYEAASGPRGPHVTGYVYNRGDNAADNVRVLVETLDARGAVAGQSLAYVTGVIPINGRRLFTTAVPRGDAYRVRVVNFDWVGRGGGPYPASSASTASCTRPFVASAAPE